MNYSALNCHCWWCQRRVFFVFKGAKRDVKRLYEAYKRKCIIARSASGWMDERLTGNIAAKLLERSHLVHVPTSLDTCSCHLTLVLKSCSVKAKSTLSFFLRDAQSTWKLSMLAGTNQWKNISEEFPRGGSWINRWRKYEKAITTTNVWMGTWGLEEVTCRYH